MRPSKPTYKPVSSKRAPSGRQRCFNRRLLSRGITHRKDFLEAIEQHLQRIADLKQASEVCAEHGVIPMLSGGNVPRLVKHWLDKFDPSKPNVVLSFRDMMEGSDVDILLMSKKPNRDLSSDDVEKVRKALEKTFQSNIADGLPSRFKRNFALDWDVNSLESFRRRGKQQGGEPVNMIAMGLNSEGKLILDDPYDGIGDMLRGTFRYVKGSDPFGTDIVVSGRMDPSLDGLRIIRAIGGMESLGLIPVPSVINTLTKLGDESLRRIWETEARLLHSPDEKLHRYWKKYVQNVFRDFVKPEDARGLLEETHFAEIISRLGFQAHIEKELPDVYVHDETVPTDIQAWVKENRSRFDACVNIQVAPAYYWTYSGRAKNALAGEKVAGNLVGPLGGGLYLRDDSMGMDGQETQCLEAHLSAGRWLNVTEAQSLVDEYLSKFQKDFPANSVLDQEKISKSFALDALWNALELDGVFEVKADGMTPKFILALHQKAVSEFTRVKDIREALIDELERGKERSVPEDVAVRSFISLRGPQALPRIQTWLEEGKLSWEGLFPQDLTSPLMSVAFVDRNFADFLEKESQRMEDSKHKEAILHAVRHLRGDVSANPDPQVSMQEETFSSKGR